MENAVAAKDIAYEPDGRFYLDEAVIEALPGEFGSVSAEACGISAWTTTGKITTKRLDGSKKLFFLKTAYGEAGGVILKGEFESAKAIHLLMPSLIPEPISYGSYKRLTPLTYFYLSEFVKMDVSATPDPVQLANKLSELHKRSRSPTGKFGFHVTTCDGKMPNTVVWEESWATFFGNLLRAICKIDQQNNGSWPEMDAATERVINSVVPRLLGNLKHEGNPIEPCLLHGDLWEPNLGVNLENGKLIMYDVSSFYAHNEMEMGLWRADFCSHLRSPIYKEQYLLKYPAAEPVDEFDDRNRLYSLKASLNYSAGHPESAVRQSAYNNMCYLCEKYSTTEGIGKYDPQKDPSVTGAAFVPDFGKRDEVTEEKAA